MTEPWTEIADRVYVRRHVFYDMNVTLVNGGERAVVVETRTAPAQGRELLAAVRTITDVPLTVVNTHAPLANRHLGGGNHVGDEYGHEPPPLAWLMHSRRLARDYESGRKPSGWPCGAG